MQRRNMVVRAASVAAEDVPSPEKRGIMNLLLLGAIGLPVSILLDFHSVRSHSFFSNDSF